MNLHIGKGMPLDYARPRGWRPHEHLDLWSLRVRDGRHVFAQFFLCLVAGVPGVAILYGLAIGMLTNLAPGTAQQWSLRMLVGTVAIVTTGMVLVQRGFRRRQRISLVKLVGSVSERLAEFNPDNLVELQKAQTAIDRAVCASQQGRTKHWCLLARRGTEQPEQFDGQNWKSVTEIIITTEA